MNPLSKNPPSGHITSNQRHIDVDMTLFSGCVPAGSAPGHAREPLYSNSAVIAWCSQSTGAQNILFWFTVIHSMSQYFTAFNFHDFFFI